MRADPSVFSYIKNLPFCKGEVDRHNILVMDTSEFAILTLISIFYSVQRVRATFARESDPRIGEFRRLSKGRLWSRPEALCQVIDEL